MVLEFVGIVSFVSLLLALGFSVTNEAPDSPSLLEWWKDLALTLLAFPTEQTLASGVGTDRAILQLTAATAGVVLPALFVGAIVLKLFISPPLFTMRNKVVAMPNDEDDPRLDAGGYHIAARGYSSTRFDLLDVTFTAIIRFERRESNGTIALIHRELTTANPHFAVSQSHVPYTLAIPIADGDWAGRPGGDLARLQGFPVGPGTDLIVMVKGSMPELSSEFTEAHHFPLPADLSGTPYAGISIDYTRPSNEWEGWDGFDEP